MDKVEMQIMEILGRTDVTDTELPDESESGRDRDE